MSNIKLTKTEQSILSEIQSGILVGRYNYHWRSGDRIKHGDELTQRQVKAVESLIAKGLVVMQNGICTIPTIQDGASAMQVGGEVLEVTADYAPATAEQVAPAAEITKVQEGYLKHSNGYVTVSDGKDWFLVSRYTLRRETHKRFISAYGKAYLSKTVKVTRIGEITIITGLEMTEQEAIDIIAASVRTFNLRSIIPTARDARAAEHAKLAAIAAALTATPEPVSTSN